MVLGEPLQVTMFLVEVFEKLGINYFVGGSLASSIHGIPRATQDVDLIAELQIKHVKNLVEALRENFYVDEYMILDAIRQKKSFNVIHLGTMFKADIFILQSNRHYQEELRRRESYKLPGNGKVLYIASAEDMILEKLRWYNLGDRMSDKHLSDVQGILKVKKNNLDLDYLEKQAIQMKLEDLLAEAQQQADSD